MMGIKNDTVYILFRRVVESDSYYEVIYIFDRNKHIDLNYLNKLYKKHYEDASYTDVFWFDTMEDLESFAENLSLNLGTSTTYILSTEDYNLGIEDLSTIEEYRMIFEKYGTPVQNPKYQGDKVKFFNKFFK